MGRVGRPFETPHTVCKETKFAVCTQLRVEQFNRSRRGISGIL